MNVAWIEDNGWSIPIQEQLPENGKSIGRRKEDESLRYDRGNKYNNATIDRLPGFFSSFYSSK
jgi:hypothetical protein